MTSIETLGIDLGKRSLHVIGWDEGEQQIKKAKFSRNKLLEFIAQLPPCTVAMEGCAGAHWLARKCQSSGHKVKLLPAQFVKPYVKSNKNDYIDAEAICEASRRPRMRFIQIKNEQQQLISAWCRIREGYVVQKNATSNKIHAFLLEFGVPQAKGKKTLNHLPELLEDANVSIPDALRVVLDTLYQDYKALKGQIQQVERHLAELLKTEPVAQRLQEIPGVGLITSALLIAKVGDGRQFKSARDMAAWIGLVPRQHSTGGKDTLLGISKRGNSQLRRCLIHGARSVIQWHQGRTDLWSGWLQRLKAHKAANIVCCALANKLARIAWAIMTSGQRFKVMA
ncbi:IS110 family RNA-guided transposase [Bowmanella dokdonensis]|uniref:IS110 family transposase n=1 Tax=Bowmanella dokdonensis TaxID=751969 RepID=A0A939DQC1_9ALTE|nr:IS110 family transposase [Bowmanella dokdonensis]MBN7826809.1 IS110 family transposase [Bowmanella dokdonensis]